MAAGTLAAPGTEYGPCEGDCEHTDCAGNRKIAAAECVHCDDPIGYGVRFYRVDTQWVHKDDRGRTHYGAVYAHASCEEARVEA